MDLKGKLSIKSCFIKHSLKISNIATTLIISGFFVLLATPKNADAGFFGSILNNQASASTYAPQLNTNSQTMALLQPNVSPNLILQNKDNKKEGKIDQSSDINIVSDNSLLPVASLNSGSSTGDVEDFSFDQTSIYVVRNGDTISKVAEMFDVSEYTILNANDLKKGDKLKEGDVLLILPFSGVEHTIVKGETLKTIASKYKIDLNDILLANDEITVDTMLSIGDKLIIPGAETPNEPVISKPKTKKQTTITGKDLQPSLPSASGYFKNPVPGARRSRGLQAHHHGVDLAAPEGTPIHAAAGGTVVIARMGFNGGFGNYVVIQHSNGMKTLYAHMSRLGTNPGEHVSQGEVIGYVGNTGDSRGNHLHIEVLGGKNPF